MVVKPSHENIDELAVGFVFLGEDDGLVPDTFAHRTTLYIEVSRYVQTISCLQRRVKEVDGLGERVLFFVDVEEVDWGLVRVQLLEHTNINILPVDGTDHDELFLAVVDADMPLMGKTSGPPIVEILPLRNPPALHLCNAFHQVLVCICLSLNFDIVARILVGLLLLVPVVKIERCILDEVVFIRVWIVTLTEN